MVDISVYRATPPDVASWRKTSYDVHKEKMSDARDIGAVRLNNSRLNLFSSLKKGDEVDHFKFDIQSNGKTRLGMSENVELSVEVLNSKGKIVASSDANSGKELLGAFLEMNENGIELEKGQYYLRVSRISLNPDTTEITYALQLSMGDEVRNDYDTLEKPPTADYDPIAAALDGASKTAPARIMSLQGTISLLSVGMISLMNLGKPFGDE